MPGEFELIERYLAPLAADNPGSLGLRDDAALLAPPEGCELVLTADALVSGVHFFPDDPAGLVARKLLRVNLSDLAAMGARPLGYLMTVAWPGSPEEAWVAAFAAGLAADQKAFEVALLGGDTTRTSGPLSLSLTAVGAVPAGQALKRSSARAGDELYVSGTIGDGALGLLVLNGKAPTLPAKQREALIDRYRLPRPRLALGRALVESGLAHAAIDVSDGLVADLGHILETSGLAGVIETERLPLSEPARALLAAKPALLQDLLTGGDDYELLFAAAAGQGGAIVTLAERLDLPISPIGRLTEGSGLRIHDGDGQEVPLARSGWTHF